MSSVERAAAHQLKEDEWHQKRRKEMTHTVDASLFHMLGEAVESPQSGLIGKVFVFLSVTMVVVTAVNFMHQQHVGSTTGKSHCIYKLKPFLFYLKVKRKKNILVTLQPCPCDRVWLLISLAQCQSIKCSLDKYGDAHWSNIIMFTKVVIALFVIGFISSTA